MKYIGHEESSDATNKQWSNFLNKFKPEDLYIGGVFGLYYSINFHEFINEQETNDFFSVLFICNSLGIDKKELLVSGKNNVLEMESKSLPLDYYNNNSSQLNKGMIENYLIKIDEDFKIQKKSITLVLNIPQDYLNGLKLNNINVVYSESFNVVKKSVDKLVNCLKNTYRKLQITRDILHAKSNDILHEYLYLLSMSWNSISNDYISQLFHSHEGTIHFDNLYSSKHSLSYWCRMHNVPIDIKLYGSFDDYIAFDKSIQVLSLTETGYNNNHIPKNNLQQNNTQSISGMQAFQAMKRLVSFLQSKNADPSVVKSAKSLENHLEYKALLEIHNYVKGENDQT